MEYRMGWGQRAMNRVPLVVIISRKGFPPPRKAKRPVVRSLRIAHDGRSEGLGTRRQAFRAGGMHLRHRIDGTDSVIH